MVLKIPENLRPTTKGVAENAAASLLLDWAGKLWSYFLLMIPSGLLVKFLAVPASDREWLVWFLAVFLVLSLGWAAIEFARNQKNQRARWAPSGSPSIPAQPLAMPIKVEEESREALTVGTHPDDVAAKLATIKASLEFLRSDGDEIAKATIGIMNSWNRVGSDAEADAMAQELQTIHRKIVESYGKTHDMRYRCREYDHVPDILTEGLDRELLPNLTNRFANTLKKTRDMQILEPFAKDWLAWMDDWRRWRFTAEDKLIELKRQLTR